MEILLVLGIVLVVAGFAWAGHRARMARREALASVAARLGMSFRPEDRRWSTGGFFARETRLAPFPLFDRGHSRCSCNHIEGALRAWERELPVTLADYSYKITSGSGKNRSTTTYSTSFLLLRLPFGGRVPGLTVRRENLGDRLAAMVGFEDIDFESAEFSRRFHVSSADRRFAYNLIDPRMIEFLLDTQPPEFAISEGWLLVTPAEGLRRWEPDTFLAACEWTRDFLARWPGFVVNDLSAP